MPGPRPRYRAHQTADIDGGEDDHRLGTLEEDLLRVTEDLTRRKTQLRWSDRSMFLFERNVMTAAYSVRKLIEARKVSDALGRKSWPLERFKLTGPVPDVWNRWEPDRLFDFASPSRVSLSTLEICNQIIHSFLFYPIWKWDEKTLRPGELEALHFVSDRGNRTHLLSVGIDALMALFTEVGHEDVIGFTMRANEHGERYLIEVIGVGRSDPRHWAWQGAAPQAPPSAV